MAANLELVIKGVDHASGVFKNIDKSASGLGHTVGNVMKAGLFVGVAAIGGLAVAGIAAANSLKRIEQIGAQTDAAIKSTGGTAGVTRKQIDDLAGTLENLTSVEAETITKGQNLLLTFTNIQNKAGEGNDVFDQATKAMVNMSVAMGQDVSNTAIQVGKALNDPIGGVTALRRVGVQLSEQQEQQIKDFMAVNDVASAQKVILGELETQFGGSGEALGKTFGGQLKIIQHQLGTLAETIMAKLMPAFMFLATQANQGLQAALPIAEKFVQVVGVMGALFGAALTGNLQKAHSEFIKLPKALWPIAQVLFDIGSFIRNTVVPAIQEFWSALTTGMTENEGTLIERVALAFRKIGMFIKNDVLPWLKNFFSQKDNLIALGGAVAALFTVWAIHAGIAAAATLAASAPLLILAAAVAGLAFAFVLLEQKTGIFSAALPVVTGFLKDLYEAVGPILYDAVVTLKQGWEDLEPAIMAVGKFLRDDVVPILQDVGKFLGEHPAILIAVAVAIGLLVAPWLVVIGTIILVLAKWDEIKAMFTQTIPQAIDSVITKIGELPIIGAIFTDAWNTVWAIVQLYVGLVLVHVNFLFDTIRNIFAFWKAIFTGEWGAAWQALKDQAKAIWDLLSGLFGLALDAIKAMADSKLDMLRSVGSSIGNAIGDTLKSTVIGALNWVIDRINDFIRKINSIPDLPFGLGGIPNIGEIGNIGGAAPGAGSQGGAIGGFAHGGIVPGPIGRPQLAVVHGGEQVLTPAQRGGTVNLYYQPMYSDASPADAERFAEHVEKALRRRLNFA